jgi:RimJ/RimL family protein N-acetyltransferase
MNHAPDSDADQTGESQARSFLRVRHVVSRDQALLRNLRLASLVADPDAFGSSYDHESTQSDAWWAAWAAASDVGTTQRAFVLVDDDDRALGLLQVSVDGQRPAAALNAMWVSPEVRGGGAATLLCEAGAAWAAERGLNELVLTVVRDNTSALRAYRAAGFVIRGQITRARDGQPFEEFVMSRAV